MRLVRERRLAEGARHDPYAGLVRVNPSPAYDLLVSLRALFNPRTYEATRAWAAATRPRLEPALAERGRFFFQGFDTALGYAAARLIGELPPGAPPAALIEAVRAADPRTLALRMLDTGETTEQALEVFRCALAGTAQPTELERALRGCAPEWARRCRRVVAEPAAVHAEYVALLEQYHRQVFAAEAPRVAAATVGAARTAEELLAVLPSVEAIERLTGGYTLGEDLALERITLAPSVFIYPFMSSRVDERAGEALILYGVRTDLFAKYDPAPLDPGLVRALKALADPARLKIMLLLSRRALFGPELITALGLGQPTVHHHLAQLRAAGLIRQERAKGGMRYSIRRESAGATIRALEELIVGPD